MNAKCPRCGSDASISLSFPNLYECPSCRCSFGPGDNGLAADSRIVRSVAISVEPIFSDAWSFSIRETDDGAAFDCRTGLMGWSRKGRGEIDKEEWQAFTASLFDDIYIASWKPMYFSPAEIKGMVWDIGIKLRHKHSLSFHGIGTVPPYWNELISLIDPFFRDIGLSVWSKDEKQA